MFSGLSRRLIAGLAALSIAAPPLEASARGVFIRDAEIEWTLRNMASRVFRVAGVDGERVRIYIIQDDSLNAFVSASHDMFFHTGLLRDLKTPEQLISVMAHETAHIRAGHLIQRVEAVQKLQTASLIAQLLGVGAAAAGGGIGGVGVGGGLQNILMRDLLKFTRGQETGADAEGLKYLNRAGVDPKAMLDVLETLQRRSPVFLSQVNPYTVSHPLTPARMAALRKGVARSPARGRKLPKDVHYWHQRMRAKLEGFLSAPGFISTDTLGSRELDLYRRAVQLHRFPRPDEAIATVNTLLKMRPNDPFYWELKGQILTESARGPQAVPALEKAHALRPKEPRIALSLGEALLTVNSRKANRRAERILENARDLDPFDPRIMRSLARAYAANGKVGRATVVTAERLELTRRYPDALRQSRIAKAKLPVGSPFWKRADDVESNVIRRVRR